MENRVRVGVIGLGPMGRDLCEQVVKNPKGEVVALCDPDNEAIGKAREIAGSQVAVFDSAEDMIAAGGMDGVIVAAPQYVHASLTIMALEAGFHVFCEKPMAMNVKECDAMIAASEAAGRHLMIGQVLRYIGPYRYVLEQVTSGRFGTPRAVRTIRSMGHWGEWARPWRMKYETCGGLLPEVNVHEIDWMINILGNPVEVNFSGDKLNNDAVDYEDFMTGIIHFENGGVGNVTSSCCDFVGRHTAEVFCRKGTIYYDSADNQVRLCEMGKEVEKIPYDAIGKEWEGGTYREIREFLEACLGEHPVTITGEQGRRAFEVCEAAYKSAREGRPVSLPLPRE